MLRAPEGCLQYYYGDTRHNVQSFNWDGTNSCSSGCIFDGQSYTVCYRPEKGEQYIEYRGLYLESNITLGI